MGEEVAERKLDRGFLPAADPAVDLPAGPPRQSITAQAPALALADHLCSRVAELPPFPLENLQRIPETRRAYVAPAFLTALYVHAPRQPPVDRLPRVLAEPLHATAARLGLPPMLTYAAQPLHNWRRIDPQELIEPENLLLLNCFQGGQDETWFITIHLHQTVAVGGPRPH
jgi:indoleamine 2,3-dioxygenase